MRDIFGKYRFWTISLPVVITLLMLIPLRFARINPNLMEYLPEGIEAKINMDKIEEIFGKTDPVLIIIEADDILSSKTLKRISDLNKTFVGMQEFKDVISLFETKYIRGEEGMMLVDPVVRVFPETDEDRDELRQEIIDNPLAYKLLVSEDFRYTLIILNPEENMSDSETFRSINKVLDENSGNEKVYFSGLPYLREEIQKKAIRDLAFLFPLGLIIMFIFFYLSLKEIRGVLLPFSVVVMSALFAMGLMPLLGYEYSLIAVLIPIMMIAIANNYGIHIIARYQEIGADNPDWSMNKIINTVMQVLYIPLILTALTTIVGVLGFVAHIMVPAKQMGIVTAVGIAFAIILSLFFIPAVLVGLKKNNIKKIVTEKKNTAIGKFLSWSGKVTTTKPRWVILVSVLFLLLVGAGIFRLQVSINLEKMMPSKHPLRISTQIADKYFGGTKNISVLFEGDILDPGLMHSMDDFEKNIKSIPETGNVLSLATIVRTISRALNDPGDPLYDVIPDSREAIAQYIEFYNMSGDPEDFEKLVDFNYTKALLNVQFRANDIRTFRKVTSKIESLIKDNPYCKLQAGQSLMEKELSESIVRGQIYSLIFAVLAIALLLGIIFKSYTAGFLGVIPLLFTLICNFGLMGWVGFDLDIATSLLSSVAIGIGVDYIIHFFWRLKFDLSNISDYKTAVKNTLSTTGRGIAINAFSVIIGFSVLFFSGLTILKAFGLLIIFSLLLCLLCALLLVPAICMIFKPEFLEKNKNKFLLNQFKKHIS